MTDQRIAWTHSPTDDGRRRGARQRDAEQRRALATVPLFEGLPPRHLKRMVEVSGTSTFADGDEIVVEGAAGSTFFVITEGTAKVVRGKRTIATCGPGDHFGELSIVAGTPRIASVIATSTPTRCVTLSARGLRKVLGEEPNVALRLLENVAKRLLAAERPRA